MLGTNAWRIGRIGGIEIKIDPSWSFIAVLVAYSFFVLLSFEFPRLTGGMHIVLAIVMAFVFFLSVLLHELAHSFMAKARGVEVHGITLFLFGGATEAELETRTPRDELVISVVGPLSSLLIAGVLWLVSLVTTPGPIGYISGYLGWINLALAVFNLIPGFPLDGGRVLRSLVWEASGDLVRATRVAARSGQIVGYVIIGLGVLQVLLLGNLIGGLWFVAIGWFLAQSAEASFTQMQVRKMLADVSAGRLMSGDLVEIPGALTLEEAVDDYFMRHDYSVFPVRIDGEVSGIVSLSAIRGVQRDDWGVRRVAEVASPLSEDCSVERSEPMDGVLEKLTQTDHHRVIVKDRGEIVGIITPRDLTRWLERSQDLGITPTLKQ